MFGPQVPSLTEYVNAILFATRNNIALRCERAL